MDGDLEKSNVSTTTSLINEVMMNREYHNIYNIQIIVSLSLKKYAWYNSINCKKITKKNKKQIKKKKQIL